MTQSIVGGGEPVFRFEGLGKRFGATQALEGLGGHIGAGEIVGLLGPNGAGKTTAMRLFLGLLRPSSGWAQVAGFDCTRDARRVKELIGYMPDEPSFYDFLTGRETIEFVLNVRGEREAGWARAEAMADRLELTPHLDEATGGYSHGTKKKLALVLALAHAPRLLLLDEPTNGLDPPSTARVRSVLREQAEHGAAVLVSTHLLDMADHLCHRVLVVHRGRIVAEGTPASIRDAAGVARGASLEHAFMALIGQPGGTQR